MTDRDDSCGRDTERIDVTNLAEAVLLQSGLNGADYFFNSGGTEYAPIWEQFAAGGDDLDLEYVGCRHEGVAVHMAMAVGILTDTPQPVGLHTNVGPLNAAMDIHGAYRSRIPMVILSSHAQTHEEEVVGGTPGHHYFDFDAPGGAENYHSRYTKWMSRPGRTENLPRHVSRAYRLAKSNPRGPVMLNISREMMYHDPDGAVEIASEPPVRPMMPTATDLASVAESISSATNPLIVAGEVARDEAGVADLVTLAETLEAPVIEHPKWFNSFPSEHPLSLGSDIFVEHFLAKDVDYVLVLGSRRPWYPPAKSAPEAEITIVSREPTEPKLPYWDYPVHVLLRGEPSDVVSQLVEAVDDRPATETVDWRVEHEKLAAYWREKAKAGENAVPIDPFHFCERLDEKLPTDAFIIQETIAHRPIITNLLESRDRRYLSTDKLLASGLGSAIGVGLGVKLVESDRPVVSLIGDGTFNYTPITGVFGAAQEHDLPTMTVVFNNGGYQSHKDTHISSFPEGDAVKDDNFVGTQFRPNPDYATTIEAWDGVGLRLDDPNEIDAVLTEGLNVLDGGRQVLIDARIDDDIPEINPPT